MEFPKKPATSIKNWAIDDRPREKLSEKGADALSNSELLAILINNGSREKSALDLAKEVMQLGDDNLNELGKLSLTDLQKIKGIGIAKAITIAAALELGRRRHANELVVKNTVSSSKAIAEYLKIKLKDSNVEVFAVVFLNKANKIKGFEIMGTGGLTGVVADPRIILKKAIEKDSTSIILSHNHPSGSLKPSNADKELTQRIKQAAAYLEINVLDHIIVSEEGYFSFADEGLI